MLFFRKDLNVWKVRVYLNDWNAKPKRAKRVPHVAFQESAYRALLKDNGAVSLDRRGAMEKFHFNAVQQVVGLCQGGKRKKQTHWKNTCETQLGTLLLFGFFLVTLAVPSSEIQCSMTGLKKRKFTSMRHTVMGRRDSCLVVRRWTSRAGNPEMDESMWTLKGKTRNDWFNRMKFDIFSSVSCAANFGLEVSLDLMKFDSLIVPKRCQTQSKRFFFSNVKFLWRYDAGYGAGVPFMMLSDLQSPENGSCARVISYLLRNYSSRRASVLQLGGRQDGEVHMTCRPFKIWSCSTCNINNHLLWRFVGSCVHS